MGDVDAVVDAATMADATADVVVVAVVDTTTNTNTITRVNTKAKGRGTTTTGERLLQRNKEEGITSITLVLQRQRLLLRRLHHQQRLQRPRARIRIRTSAARPMAGARDHHETPSRKAPWNRRFSTSRRRMVTVSGVYMMWTLDGTG